MRGTHAHTAVHPVRLSKLERGAGPVFEDVSRAWRRSASRSQDGRRRPFPCVSYRTAMAPPRPRTDRWLENLVDLQTLDGHGDVVGGDMERGGFIGVVVEDALCQSSGEVLGQVGCVMGIGAGFTVGY